MFVLELPIELLIKVVASLDLLDIIHLEATCRALRRLVLDSVELQYIKELAASQCIPAYPNPSASCRERLDALKARETAWRTFLVSSEERLMVHFDIELERGYVEQLISGNFLVRVYRLRQGRNLAGIAWSRLPSRCTYQGGHEIKQESSGGYLSLRGEDFVDCLVDIERDFCVFLKGHHRSLHFWSLSKRSRHHPEVASPFVFPDGGSHYILQSMRGDTVLVRVSPMMIRIVHWRSGESYLYSDEASEAYMLGASYLTETIILLVYNDYPGHMIAILDISNKSAGSPPLKGVLFEFPVLKRSYETEFWLLPHPGGGTFPVMQGESSHPVNPDSGIVIVYFNNLEADSNDLHFVMDIPSLLQLYRCHVNLHDDMQPLGLVKVHWDAWGPRTCRALMAEGNGRSFHGSRVILKHFAPNSDVSPPTVEVFDFNPYARRNHVLLDESVTESLSHYAQKAHVEARYVDAPSTIVLSDFEQDITTSLPYWSVSRRCETKWDEHFVFDSNCVVPTIEDAPRVLIL